MNKHIIEFLEYNGISVAALADHVGITRATLNNKLKGNRNEKLTAEQREAIKKYLLRLADDARLLAAELDQPEKE